jgi:hypothetical protein
MRPPIYIDARLSPPSFEPLLRRIVVRLAEAHQVSGIPEELSVASMGNSVIDDRRWHSR